MSLEGQQQGQGEPGSGGGPASDPNLQQSLTPPPPSDFEPQSPGVIAKAPPAYEPAIQAGYSDMPPTVAAPPPPPGGMRPELAPAGPGSGTTAPSRPKGRVILLAGLALLIIASGVSGIFYVVRSNQIATANAHATATAAVFNATGTAQAQSIAATVDAYYATATTVAANATGTATAYQNLYNSATSGTPTLSDPLSDNSNGNRWSEGTDSTGTCAFAGGTYHASSSQKNIFVFCDAQSTDFRNFAYQVQMKIIKGEDGGIIFRANDTNGTFYVFTVDQIGSYELFVCPPKATKCNSDLLINYNLAINQGLNQTNVVTVVVKGNTITLYVNQQEIDSVTDNTFSHGQIGVIALDINNPTEVVYKNAKVWTL